MNASLAGISRTVITVIVALVIIVAGFSVYFLAGSSPSSSSSQGTSSTTPSKHPTVVLNWGVMPFFESAPAMLIYNDTKRLNASGIDIHVVRGFGSSANCFSAIASGSIDVCIASLTPAAMGLMDKGIMSILAATATMKGGYNASNNWAVVVSPNAWNQGVRTLKDLYSPRTIADAAAGTAGETMIQEYSERNGLNFSKFAFTHISQATALLSALISNKIDAAVFSSPYPSQAVAEGARLLLWDTQMLAPGEVAHSGLFYLRTAWYNAHPDAARALANLYGNQSSLYDSFWLAPRTDPRIVQTAQWVAQYIGPTTNATQVLRMAWQWMYSPVSITYLSTTQEFLYQDKLITSTVPVAQWLLPVTQTVP